MADRKGVELDRHDHIGTLATATYLLVQHILWREPTGSVAMTFKFDGPAVINLILVLGLLGFMWKMSSDIRNVGDTLRVEMADVRAEVADVRAELADVRAEVADVRAEVADVSERLARIEGWIEGRFDDVQASAHLPDTLESSVSHAFP